MSKLPGLRTDLDWELIKKLYDEDRFSSQRLADIYGVSPTTIVKGLKVMGVYVHNRNFDCAKSIDNERLKYLYEEEEMNSIELAVLCKVSKTTILRRLKEAGANIRHEHADSTYKFSDDELLAVYNECPRSCSEMGEILGVQGRTVERRLKELGYEVLKCDDDEELTRRKRSKNMVESTKWDITLEWVLQFEDIDKLMFLNEKTRQAGRGYQAQSTEQYVEFVEHFYYDEQFNKHYERWKTTGSREDKPSLDHITPRSMGGSDDISNLAFVSWFENRAKNDLDLIGYLEAVEHYYGFEARKKTELRFNIGTDDISMKFCLPNETDVEELLDDSSFF